MRILMWDVESLPSIVHTFQHFKTSINHTAIIEHQALICIAWKWYGQKKVHLTSIADDPQRMDKNIYDDSHVAKTFRQVLDTDESFVMLGHNLKSFDIKKFNTSCIRNGLDPVPERQVIDTLTSARKYFRFESNKLDFICRTLGIGEKISTGGLKLWNDIVQAKYPEVGHESSTALRDKSLSIMGKYCKQDVSLLEPLYNKISSWMTTHPNASLYQSDEISCTKCGSTAFRFCEWRYTNKNKYKRYICSRGHRFDPPARLKKLYDHAGNTINHP